MQSGKRQRRQAAAQVVQSLWSSNSKKKPTSSGNNNNNNNNGNANNNQRPAIEVPPMAFGPIRTPNHNDVLCGRGGLINGSPGNVQFRNIVAKRKKDYNAKTCKRADKAHMAAEIVRQIRSMDPPGRFLREDANGLWFDVGDARAIRKTGQALREAAPAIRQEGDNDTTANNNPAEDKASESGSDQEGKEETQATTTAGTATKEKKKESPKKKKNTAVSASPEKEPLSATSSDLSSEISAKKSSTAEAPVMGDSSTRNNSKQSGRKGWLPNMMGGNRSNKQNNSDTVSVSADTVRSSGQAYYAPVATMPRMSPGAVFSNAHHGSRARTSEQALHPYPPQHPQYPYPYAHYMPPPMYPAMQHHPHYPPHPHGHHVPPYPQSAPPPPMVPTRGAMPRDYSEDAFGMYFFPTRDVRMEHSENGSSCTVSDISGLSSAMTSSDHQRKPIPTPRKAQRPQPESNDADDKLLAPPPPTSGGQSVEEVSMLDTSSSLPSFSDIVDDVDMASANSGGLGVFSPAASKSKGPSTPKRGSTSSIRGDTNMKENSNAPGSCLSGKSGSCVSGKSELSLPSSCGTALSQFSDSFMALHLSDNNSLE